MATEQTAVSSTLQDLRAKYKTQGEYRADSHASFDKRNTMAPTRASQSPADVRFRDNLGGVQKEIAAIQLDMIDFVDEHGKLNAKFLDAISKGGKFTLGEYFRMKFYGMTGNKTKVKAIKVDAMGRKSDSMITLVDLIGDVANEILQSAKQGKSRAEQLQTEVVSHMKYLHSEFVKNLSSGNYTGVDEATAQREVDKFKKELSDLDDVIGSYEGKIRTAKTANDLDQVRALAKELDEVYQMQHGVLDGRLAADGVVSEIRRQLLDAAEGAQSAKGAIAASKVNYEAATKLVDIFNEQEIKYRHACDHMLKVFKQQAQVYTATKMASDMKDALLKMSELSNRLMQSNAKMVMQVAEDTFELLQASIYDPDQTRAIREKLEAHTADLNARKKEWAEAQLTGTEGPQEPGYAKP